MLSLNQHVLSSQMFQTHNSELEMHVFSQSQSFEAHTISVIDHPSIITK